MKKITLVLFTLSTIIGFSQSLNQAANWPNSNWTLSGNYLTTDIVLEANPTTTNRFAYDDDDAGNNHQDNIAAESPIINLSTAFANNEHWITVSSSYVYNKYGATLKLQYWDADSSIWIDWGSDLDGNSFLTNNYCNGTDVDYSSDHVDISSFTANQLSNFRYRISYDDANVGNFWAFGFCFQSPTISSQMIPTCPDITNLSVADVTVDAANISWDAGSTETNWEIAVQTFGLGTPTGPGTPVTSNNPYALSDLDDGTGYEVYVRASCGGADFSDWVGPAGFTTLIIARVNFIQQSFPVANYDLAVVDMNGDHLDDIVGGGSNSVEIHFQQSTGGFNEVIAPVSSGVVNFLPTWSMAAADYDGNGYTDLLFGNGSGVSFLRANENGTAFTGVSGPDYVFSQRSNFADINNDGHLDAFVCHDVAPNVYYINDGSGNFEFFQSGVTANAPFNLGDYPSGGDYGSIWIDYDNDRDLDMFIAKCGGEEARRRNQMLTNNGDGTYSENANIIGLSDPMQTWSSSWGDYDNDGDMDVFVGASSGTHKLMRNEGDGTFSEVTPTNLNIAPTGHENVSHDFDNDGNLDIACNGTIMYGNGDMTFEDIDPNQLNYKNGSFGDLNNDGFLDSYYNETIYMNATTPNNWITINTVGTESNIDGIGARVELYTDAGIQIRDVRSGEGFEFMSSLNTHFGIGLETSINTIIIYWPSGVIDTVTNPDINTPLEVVEGSTLSLEDYLVNDLVIYPNPSKRKLTISGSSDLQDAIYTVFDINGKRIINAKLVDQTVDVSTLETGHYIIRIVSGNTIKSQKFMKQ
ncbi:MAG: FG-GAP-like repeat-containing protein [Psychroserpens sp.]|uniref:FG-GAP-like repeat-containing protein n=1 Tax=Psychroserpens sp. TaxID=2020870 RepID=UPI003C731721